MLNLGRPRIMIDTFDFSDSPGIVTFGPFADGEFVDWFHIQVGVTTPPDSVALDLGMLARRMALVISAHDRPPVDRADQVANAMLFTRVAAGVPQLNCNLHGLRHGMLLPLGFVPGLDGRRFLSFSLTDDEDDSNICTIAVHAARQMHTGILPPNVRGLYSGASDVQGG